MDKSLVEAGMATPFDGYRDVVRPEWIDGNGHMKSIDGIKALS